MNEKLTKTTRNRRLIFIILKEFKNTETHISLCKQILAQKFLNLQILRDQNKTERLGKMHTSII
jgi:hypothetical protein